MTKSLAESFFEGIKCECDPNRLHSFGDVFDFFFGAPEKSNFIGGCGDPRRTLHEEMFHLMHPDYLEQAPFGTGVGGYKKYGAKRYIADFYDEENRVVYEIDGRSHKTDLRQLKDKLREYCFLLEHGIRVIRHSNEEVERMLMEHLKHLEENGTLQRAATLMKRYESNRVRYGLDREAL